MLELVALTIAYSAVGLVVLVVGFVVLDLLTPGKLGELVMERNPNAAILSAGILVSLGRILWFAIYFPGRGWDGLVDAAVFGAVGVLAQAAGFLVLDLLTPGRLGAVATEPKLHPAVFVAAAAQLAIALVVCASLT
jgi:uncharacterized membrane protein YjfL (UPF0719 family)